MKLLKELLVLCESAAWTVDEFIDVLMDCDSMDPVKKISGVSEHDNIFSQMSDDPTVGGRIKNDRAIKIDIESTSEKDYEFVATFSGDKIKLSGEGVNQTINASDDLQDAVFGVLSILVARIEDIEDAQGDEDYEGDDE